MTWMGHGCVTTTRTVVSLHRVRGDGTYGGGGRRRGPGFTRECQARTTIQTLNRRESQIIDEEPAGSNPVVTGFEGRRVEWIGYARSGITSVGRRPGEDSNDNEEELGAGREGSCWATVREKWKWRTGEVEGRGRDVAETYHISNLTL